MTLRRELCDALDHVTDLSALVDQGDLDTRIARITVLDTELETLGQLCDEVMHQAPADEELCRAETGAPYLRRWWLRRAPAAEQSSRAVYLHEIIGPDEEPPHNHPWDSASLVVAGRLTDVEFLADGQGRLTQRTWRLNRGDVVYRPASHCHLLTSAPAAITLFVTGERTQPWGFLRPDGTFGRDRGEHALRGRRAHLEHPQTA